MNIINQLACQPQTLLNGICQQVYEKKLLGKTTQRIKEINNGVYIVTQHQLIDSNDVPYFKTKPTNAWSIGSANLARHDAISHAFTVTGINSPGELANSALLEALGVVKTPLDSPTNSEMRSYPGLYEDLLKETQALIKTNKQDLTDLFKGLETNFDKFWGAITNNGSHSPRHDEKKVFEYIIPPEHLANIWSCYERALTPRGLTVWDMFKMKVNNT